VKSVWATVPVEIRSETEVLFSCHSIPAIADKACSSCIYSAEYETASRLVAKALAFPSWKSVYQSRSGSPEQAWLEPDILNVIRQSAASGKKAVFVIPMGFLSDNAEVLYDLDVEAKSLAEELGIGFYRVPTPGNHPGLIKLFEDLISRRMTDSAVYGSCSA